MGSSLTRDRTHVPCIGRWILNHCATREVHGLIFLAEKEKLAELINCDFACSSISKAHCYITKSLFFDYGHLGNGILTGLLESPKPRSLHQEAACDSTSIWQVASLEDTQKSGEPRHKQKHN